MTMDRGWLSGGGRSPVAGLPADQFARRRRAGSMQWRACNGEMRAFQGGPIWRRAEWGGELEATKKPARESRAALVMGGLLRHFGISRGAQPEDLPKHARCFAVIGAECRREVNGVVARMSGWLGPRGGRLSHEGKQNA